MEINYHVTHVIEWLMGLPRGKCLFFDLGYSVIRILGFGFMIYNITIYKI
jgi:hypothetical protein